MITNVANTGPFATHNTQRNSFSRKLSLVVCLFVAFFVASISAPRAEAQPGCKGCSRMTMGGFCAGTAAGANALCDLIPLPRRKAVCKGVVAVAFIACMAGAAKCPCA